MLIARIPELNPVVDRFKKAGLRPRFFDDEDPEFVRTISWSVATEEQAWKNRSIDLLYQAEASLMDTSGISVNMRSGINSCCSRIRKSILDPREGALTAIHEALFLAMNFDSPVGTLMAQSPSFRRFLESLPGYAENFNGLISDDNRSQKALIDSAAPHPRKAGYIERAIRSLITDRAHEFLKRIPSFSPRSAVVDKFIAALNPDELAQGVVVVYKKPIHKMSLLELDTVAKLTGAKVFVDNPKEFENHKEPKVLILDQSKIIGSDGHPKASCGLKNRPAALIFCDTPKNILELGEGNCADFIFAA